MKLSSGVVGILIALALLAVAGLGSGTLQIFHLADSPTPLMRAAFLGDVATLQRLLDKGVDINERRGYSTHLGVFVVHGPNTPQYGETALLEAIRGPSPEAVRLLLEAGADISVRDSVGKDIWEYALHNTGEPGPTMLLRLAQWVPRPRDLADRILTAERPPDDNVLEFALGLDNSVPAREAALCNAAVRGDILAMDRLLQTFAAPPAKAFECAYRAWGETGTAERARMAVDYLIASGADTGGRAIPLATVGESRYACPLICIKTAELQGCNGGCAVPVESEQGGSGSGYRIQGAGRDHQMGTEARFEVVLRHVQAGKTHECTFTLDGRVLGPRSAPCDKSFGPARVTVMPQ